jgi:hypothetical protein
MNNDTDTITLTRERFRALIDVAHAAEGLLEGLEKDSRALTEFYTERLADRIATNKALRDGEWAEIRERSAQGRERTRALLDTIKAERDLGVD